jgi:hypothetical protein
MSLKRRGSAQSWLLVFHAWKGSFPGSVGDHAPALARLGWVRSVLGAYCLPTTLAAGMLAS